MTIMISIILTHGHYFEENIKIEQFSAHNFSSSVDLDWHLSPEGQSVFAHLKDPVTGARRSFGENVLSWR